MILYSTSIGIIYEIYGMTKDLLFKKHLITKSVIYDFIDLFIYSIGVALLLFEETRDNILAIFLLISIVY